jgi:tellurite resistance protein TerC
MTPPAPPPPTKIRGRDAAVSAACVAAGAAFTAVVLGVRGPEAAKQYAAGYLIELSLSVDNVFVFALIFAQLGVEPARQRRLLTWGILGAVALRTGFIVAGIGAIRRFAWVIPAFGAFILVTAVRLAAGRRPRPALGDLASRLAGRLPAAVAALAAVEAADFIFALDSLPAVLAVTHDPAVAVASNLFAILGLRSLFFVVSGAMRTLRFLNRGVAAVLALVGAKMLAQPWYAVPTGVSLAVVAGVLAVAVAASLAAPDARP